MSVEVGYVGNRGRHAFVGDGPDVGLNDPTLVGFPGIPRDNRKPFFSGQAPTTVGGYGGSFGWTQGINIFCNCGKNSYDSLQARFNRRFKDGYSYQMNYTWQKAQQDDGSLLLLRPEPEPRAHGLGSDAHVQLDPGLRAAVRQEQEVGQ